MTIYLIVFYMVLSWFTTDFKIDVIESDSLINALKENI